MEYNGTDKLHDECGVVGIYQNSKSGQIQNAATLAYFGLYALQHRGQDSAGIAVSSGSDIKVHKQMGLVSDVFGKENLTALDARISVGHIRYSTAGAKTIENAQPMVNRLKLGTVAVAHNGQLVNYEQLREMRRAANIKIFV